MADLRADVWFRSSGETGTIDSDKASTSQDYLHIAHETTICRKPPIHSFIGQRKNLADP
jgi:hypothetical protein